LVAQPAFTLAFVANYGLPFETFQDAARCQPEWPITALARRAPPQSESLKELLRHGPLREKSMRC
jgi:hypothetical protein